MESDFDQYGDMEAFGVHPDWQRQLSKFASVQDRLREWKPSVMSKLTVFSCMAITALDIDGIRVDKSTQLSVDGMTAWATATRACATNLGKKNFYITGEVTGGDTFGSLYMYAAILVVAWRQLNFIAGAVDARRRCYHLVSFRQPT
jgi:alpha-1,3-glucan synthase